ncbi:MAG TPA: flavin reductase [Bacillota bacterium]|nr:flavin reductase [Bacillota bacterium]
MLCLHERHLSRETIDKTGWFSVNLPEQKWLAEIEYCGMVSGREIDKVKLFKNSWHRDLPVIETIPVVLLCGVALR